MFCRALITLLLTMISCTLSYAQSYPVQISTQLVPPFSGYLPDYASPGNDNLRIYLSFTDFSLPSYDVKLKFSISGNNVSIQSKPWYYAGPITLEPGVPLMLTGTDLSGLLSSANLDYSGITLAQYNQSKVLPEGFYTIEVTAYDFANPLPIPVSNIGTTQAWMMLCDPPLTNLPACGSEAITSDPQFLTFSWSPLNMSSPVSALGTEYLFELWEVMPPNNNPNNVVLATAPIYTTTTNFTMVTYGLTEPPLQVGWTYVWRVRAYDLDGRALFRNNGYSQICTFTYGDESELLGNLANLTLNAQVLTHRQARCIWDSLGAYASYHLEFRKLNTTNWFSINTANSNARITALEPLTQYEAQVHGIFPNGNDGPWSNIVTFTTPAQAVLNCGEASPPPAQQNYSPLTTANVGMIWQVGQFEMVVTQLNALTNPNGMYSGLGKVIMPLGITLNVQYNNIQIGEDQVMYAGTVNAITEGAGMWLNQYNASGFVSPEITYNGEINSPTEIQVNILNNTITISGNTFEYESGEGTAIEDSNGTLWVVDNSGNVILAGQTGVTFIPPPPSELNTTNGKATFSARSSQLYGYDHLSIPAWSNYYMQVHDIKDDSWNVVDWKSVQKGKYDVINVQYSNLDGVVADSIFLYCPAGTIYRPQGSGLNRYFYVVGGDANDRQDIYAAYRNAAGEIVNIGKLSVTSFEEETKQFYLVPFAKSYSALPNITAQQINQIQQALDSIYKGAVIKYQVSIAPSPLVESDWDLNSDNNLDVSGEGVTAYCEEMDAAISALKLQPWFQSGSKYLFITTIQPDSTIPGFQGSMPRKKDFGFIFSNPSSPQFIVTIAHEVAHGVFSLEHSFEGTAPAPKSSTNNLLDYSSGTNLVHWQWYWMHNPSGWPGLDGEEDNDRVYVDMRDLLPFINSDSATFTFLTPAGKPLTIPKAGLERVVFSYGDDYKSCDNGMIHNAPIGALSSFKLNGINYLGTADCNSSTFNYYKNLSANKTYIDSLSQQINPASAIVGHPCIANGRVVFVVTKSNITGNVTYGEDYKGGGPFKDHLLVWDGFTLQSNTTQIEADINPPYSPDAHAYLTNHLDAAGCGELGISYVLTYAYQINRYPNTYECCIKHETTTAPDPNSQNVIYVPPPDAYASIPTNTPQQQKEQELQQLAIDTKVNFRELEAKRKSVNTELLAIPNHSTLAGYLWSLPPYTCIWNSMYAKTRIHCLTVLQQSTVQGDWLSFGNNYERLMNDIIMTTADIGQQDSILSTLQGNDCAMFKSLWNVLDLDGLDEFISTITGWIIQRDPVRPTFASIHTQWLQNVGNPNATLKYFEVFGENNVFHECGHMWAGGNINFSTNYDPDGNSTTYQSVHSETTLGAYDWIAIKILEDIPSLGLKENQTMVVPMIWAMWLSHRIHTNELSHKLELIAQVVLFLATDYVGNMLFEGLFQALNSSATLGSRFVGQEIQMVVTSNTRTATIVSDVEIAANNQWLLKNVRFEPAYNAEAAVIGKIQNAKFVRPTGEVAEGELIIVETAQSICVRDATAVYSPGTTISSSPSWLPNRTITGNLTNPKGIIGVYNKTMPNGNIISDTKNVLEELAFPELTNANFTTASKGGFKLLNTPMTYYQNPTQFWTEYNMPWLDALVDAHADIVVLSNRTDDLLLYVWDLDVNTGQVIFRIDPVTNLRITTGFGNEINYMNNLVNQGKYEWIESEGLYRFIAE